MKNFFSILLLCGLVLSVVEPAHSQGAGAPGQGGISLTVSNFADRTIPVGQEVCFPLTARDDNGNIIRSWDQIGQPVTITLYNTDANSDTSTQSWNADPDGYSFVRVLHNGTELTKITDHEWSLPETAFINGTTEICILQTKADTGVYFEITPKVAPLNQVSETMTFTAGGTTNFLVDLTSSIIGADQVFQYRKYEKLVYPRDKYLNITNEQIRTKFTARWPGEFVNSQPGLSDIFSGEVFIDEPTNYFLASTIIRELPTSTGQLQWIRAFKSDDPSITGQSDDYEILSHAPYEFALVEPVHGTRWEIDSASNRREFTWDQPNPPDPYTNILISNITGEIGSDQVTYEWVCIDSTSLTCAQRLSSNNGGIDPKLSVSNQQIVGVGSGIAGTSSWTYLPVYWFVEATDGLYTTRSTPPTNDPQMRPGHYLLLIRGVVSVEKLPAAPTGLVLHQNYPNPFNPSTTIRFETVQLGNVSLKVYDLVGNEVATLVNEHLAPGVYTVPFDANDFSTGVYIYRLTSNGKTFTKRMILTK